MIVKSHNVTKTNSMNKYIFCSALEHRIYNFHDFRKKIVPECRDFFKTNYLCFNCLGKGHGINQCTNNKSCFTCHQRHHSLLYEDAQQSVNNTSNDQSKETAPSAPAPPDTNNSNTSAVITSSSSTNFTFYFASSRIGSTILLGTVLVQVYSENGRSTFARALIDFGSEVTCIAESLVKRLHLHRTQCSIPIFGIGEQQIEWYR